jgi:antitoxin component YwqK of YwqJK toxin-antitoxin module
MKMDKEYYENGQIKIECSYKNGCKDGLYIKYDDKGIITDKIMYKNDEKQNIYNYLYYFFN